MPGEVAFVGDSHVQIAPLLEMLTGCSQRGIGGQSIDDVRSWVGSMSGARRMVLMVGTNDLSCGATATEVGQRYAALLDAVPGGVEPVILGIPPGEGWEVDPANDLLEQLAVERGVRFHRLPDLTGCSDDGTHVNTKGYERLAPLLRSCVSDPV
jgi:lysophospholipase L1-like esterase